MPNRRHRFQSRKQRIKLREHRRFVNRFQRAQAGIEPYSSEMASEALHGSLVTWRKR